MNNTTASRRALDQIEANRQRDQRSIDDLENTLGTRLMTANQTAQLLQVSVPMLAKLISAGHLSPVEVCGSRRYRLDETLHLMANIALFAEASARYEIAMGRLQARQRRHETATIKDQIETRGK